MTFKFQWQERRRVLGGWEGEEITRIHSRLSHTLFTGTQTTRQADGSRYTDTCQHTWSSQRKPETYAYQQMATVEIGTHTTTEIQAGEGDHKAIFIIQKWYFARNNYTKLHHCLLLGSSDIQHQPFDSNSQSPG